MESDPSYIQPWCYNRDLLDDEKNYQKKWRAENPDYMKNYQKKWRAENPDYMKNYQKKWLAENPDYMKNYHKKYRKEKKTEDEKYNDFIDENNFKKILDKKIENLNEKLEKLNIKSRELGEEWEKKKEEANQCFQKYQKMISKVADIKKRIINLENSYE